MSEFQRIPTERELEMLEAEREDTRRIGKLLPGLCSPPNEMLQAEADGITVDEYVAIVAAALAERQEPEVEVVPW